MTPICIRYPAIYALKRHRHGKHGNYDASLNDKNAVAPFYISAAKRAGINGPLDCPIAAICIFTKARPNKKKGLHWDTKPDIDNLEKFVFDVAEKQAGIIKNDSRICMKISRKFWGEHDRTDILLLRVAEDSIFFANGSVVGVDKYGYFYNDRTFKKIAVT